MVKCSDQGRTRREAATTRTWLTQAESNALERTPISPDDNLEWPFDIRALVAQRLRLEEKQLREDEQEQQLAKTRKATKAEQRRAKRQRRDYEAFCADERRRGVSLVLLRQELVWASEYSTADADDSEGGSGSRTERLTRSPSPEMLSPPPAPGSGSRHRRRGSVQRPRSRSPQRMNLAPQPRSYKYAPSRRPPPVDFSDSIFPRTRLQRFGDRRAQHDNLQKRLDALVPVTWTSFGDSIDEQTIQDFVAEIRQDIRNGTFLFRDVPCIGPVDGTSLRDVRDANARAGLSPEQSAAEERKCFRRNDSHHTCARNHAFAQFDGSAAIPCPPCRNVNAGCYYEICRYGDDCRRAKCPSIHPSMTAMLVLAFALLGIPTEDAKELANKWVERHEWNFPREDYHFDTVKAGIRRDSSLPPRGCAKEKRPAQNGSEFALSPGNPEGVTWHQTALIDLDHYRRTRQRSRNQRQWIGPAQGGFDHNAGALRQAPLVLSEDEIQRRDLQARQTPSNASAFQRSEALSSFTETGRPRLRNGGRSRRRQWLRRHET